MIVRLGVDIACRAAHQASLATENGSLLWSGRRFRTDATELAQLWASLPTGTPVRPRRVEWTPVSKPEADEQTTAAFVSLPN
jgi:hypothetical protein